MRASLGAKQLRRLLHGFGVAGCVLQLFLQFSQSLTQRLPFLGGILQRFLQPGHDRAGLDAVLVEVCNKTGGLLEGEASLFQCGAVGSQSRGKLIHADAGVLSGFVQDVQHVTGL